MSNVVSKPIGRRWSVLLWSLLFVATRTALPDEPPPIEPIRSWESPHRVNAVAIDEAGSVVAAAGPHGSVTLWRADDGTLLRRCVGSHDDATCAALSPDGSLLAVGGIEGNVRVFDIASGQPKYVLGEHGSRLLSVAFSPDGTLLASTCWDGVLRWWKAADGSRVGDADGPRVGLGRFCFTPASDEIAIPYSQWRGNPPTAQINPFLFEIRSVRCEDGRLGAQVPLSLGPWTMTIPRKPVLFGAGMEDGSVVVWSNLDGKEIARWTIASDGNPIRQPGIVCLAFLPEGRLFAMTMSGGGGIWSHEGNRLAVLDRSTDGFVTADVSPKNYRLALSRWDHTIELFDLSKER